MVVEQTRMAFKWILGVRVYKFISSYLKWLEFDFRVLEVKDMYVVYDENSFCDMLRKYRLNKGYSQTSFAKEMSVSRQAVNEWEKW